MTKNKNIKIPAKIEIGFDLFYLTFAAVAGILLLFGANGDAAALLYGIMTLVLCFGDAFHLFPRIYCLWTDTMAAHTKELGLGKFITSITMTVFYVLLYFLWTELFPGKNTPFLTALILVLAVIRIGLCLCPQNRWTGDSSDPWFSLYRNIPFVMLGALIAVLFTGIPTHGPYSAFTHMPLAIVLSFVFYLIVVLFSGTYKKAGIFMLPKTCVYLWIICMGFSLI